MTAFPSLFHCGNHEGSYEPLAGYALNPKLGNINFLPEKAD